MLIGHSVGERLDPYLMCGMLLPLNEVNNLLEQTIASKEYGLCILCMVFKKDCLNF